MKIVFFQKNLFETTDTFLAAYQMWERFFFFFFTNFHEFLFLVSDFHESNLIVWKIRKISWNLFLVVASVITTEMFNLLNLHLTKNNFFFRECDNWITKNFKKASLAEAEFFLTIFHNFCTMCLTATATVVSSSSSSSYSMQGRWNLGVGGIVW